MRNKEEKIHECDCDKPDVRNLFKNGCCSDEQIMKCHGKENLLNLKRRDD